MNEITGELALRPRLCALAFGRKRSSRMDFSTRSRSAGFTSGRPLRTRETVPTATPACLATSLMVTAIRGQQRWREAVEIRTGGSKSRNESVHERTVQRFAILLSEAHK